MKTATLNLIISGLVPFVLGVEAGGMTFHMPMVPSTTLPSTSVPTPFPTHGVKPVPMGKDVVMNAAAASTPSHTKKGKKHHHKTGKHVSTTAGSAKPTGTPTPAVVPRKEAEDVATLEARQQHGNHGGKGRNQGGPGGNKGGPGKGKNQGGHGGPGGHKGGNKGGNKGGKKGGQKTPASSQPANTQPANTASADTPGVTPRAIENFVATAGTPMSSVDLGLQHHPKGQGKGPKQHKTPSGPKPTGTPSVSRRDEVDAEAAAATPTSVHWRHGAKTPISRLPMVTPKFHSHSTLMTRTTPAAHPKPTRVVKAGEAVEEADVAAATSTPTKGGKKHHQKPKPTGAKAGKAHSTPVAGKPKSPPATTPAPRSVRFSPLKNARRAMVFGNRF